MGTVLVSVAINGEVREYVIYDDEGRKVSEGKLEGGVKRVMLSKCSDVNISMWSGGKGFLIVAKCPNPSVTTAELDGELVVRVLGSGG